MPKKQVKWTPARKRAHGEKIRAGIAARRANGGVAVAARQPRQPRKISAVVRPMNLVERLDLAENTIKSIRETLGL